MLRRHVLSAINNEEQLLPITLEKLIGLNPEYWETYYLVGKYNYENKYYQAALNAFQEARTKEITTVPDQEQVDLYIKKIKRKLN